MTRKFRVTGQRGDREFQAPVEAEDAETAIETFKEQVEAEVDQETGWYYLEAEEW